MLRERMLHVALLTVLLGLLTATLRDTRRAGLTRDYYWDLKFTWRDCADVVLTGDSRVAYGLSPAAMGEVLPNQRIKNFAFAAGAYSQSYLDAVDRVLDDRGDRPTVVMGITARTLIDPSRIPNGNGYECFREEAAARSGPAQWIARALPFTGPMRLDALAREFNPWRRGEEIRYADGWTAQYAPRDGAASARKQREVHGKYEAIYAQTSFDPNAAERVLARVRDWTARGVRVFGFRPPSAPELRCFENERSGFCEAEFAAAFEASGGQWLDVPPFEYDTYDDSHLYADAAVALSKDVAGAMQSDARVARRAP